MPNIIKPFKVLSVNPETDGGQGVTFQAFKTEYLTDTKTRTITMTNYLSVPANEDVDSYLFNYLSEGGWI